MIRSNGACAWHTGGTVAHVHDRVQLDLCQGVAGRIGQLRVQLDGDDVRVADPVCQQRSVVAGAGADLQHPLAAL